jgi:hypothetical protein
MGPARKQFRAISPIWRQHGGLTGRAAKAPAAEMVVNQFLNNVLQCNKK